MPEGEQDHRAVAVAVAVALAGGRHESPDLPLGSVIARSPIGGRPRRAFVTAGFVTGSFVTGSGAGQIEARSGAGSRLGHTAHRSQDSDRQPGPRVAVPMHAGPLRQKRQKRPKADFKKIRRKKISP